MNVVDLLTLERVIHRPAVRDKTSVLEMLSECLAHATPGATRAQIFDCLASRERLGSTGLGWGVAIPHGRLAGAVSAAGALIKLDRGVDYGAPDGKPVDIVFALLAPAESCKEHLELLAQLAGIFAHRQLLAELRSTVDARDALALLRREGAARAA